MKHLKKKSDLEIFVNKSLKSGKKYKYYVYFKNLIKFYLKYMKIFGIINRKKVDKLKDENKGGFKKKIAPLIREDNIYMVKYMKRSLFNDIARINTMHREFIEEINREAIENNKLREESKKIVKKKDEERRISPRFDTSFDKEIEKKNNKTEKIEEDTDLVLIKQLINKSSIKENFHNFLYNVKVIKKKKKKFKTLNVINFKPESKLLNETCKLFNRLIWHLNIRSYNSKLFYTIYSLNNRHLNNIKIYKYLTKMYFLSSEKSVIKKKKFLKLKKNLKLKKKNRFKRKIFKHHVFINSNILYINRYERFLNSWHFDLRSRLMKKSKRFLSWKIAKLFGLIRRIKFKFSLKRFFKMLKYFKKNNKENFNKFFTKNYSLYNLSLKKNWLHLKENFKDENYIFLDKIFFILYIKAFYPLFKRLNRICKDLNYYKNFLCYYFNSLLKNKFKSKALKFKNTKFIIWDRELYKKRVVKEF